MGGGIGAPRDFPVDLRGGLLSYIAQTGKTKAESIWWRFAQHEGYGTIDDYLTACDRRFGEGAADTTRERMEAAWDRFVAQTPSAQAGSPEAVRRVKEIGLRPRLVLLAMPDADFRVALEHGLLLAVRGMSRVGFGMRDVVGEVAVHVNTLFEKRGVPYRLDRELQLNFHGDPGERELVIAPALAALADPRLAGARSEFEDALTKLGAGRPKDVEDAIEESRKAVESAMKVLIDAHGLPRTGKEPTEPLIMALVNGNVVESQTSDLLRAAARIANAQASHGAGAVVRQVPDELAAAAVSVAATAITFLAARLP